MKQSVALIKRAVKIPVIVKLSGTFAHIVPVWAKGVKEAGADGIGCSDSLGPALAIDIRTGQPRLGGPRGVGGLTGAAIMPITLRMVLEIASTVDLPILGVGGVSSAEDVIQYLMAGATLVGACTAGHVQGIERYSRIIAELERLLETLGVGSPKDICGLTLRRIEERKEKGLQAVTQPVPAVVDTELCNGCGNCQRVCAYGAARLPGGEGQKALIDPQRCIGCGLCPTVCPVQAIHQVYYA
jgi:ferredoxin